MNEASQMLKQATCEDTLNVTSSPESGGGRTLCGLPAGPTTDMFGQEVAPASRSRRQEASEASATNGTYGRSGENLSPTAALQSFLESKLRARLGGNGCPAFALIWKTVPMPSGPPISALQASESGTADNDCIGLPSPITKYDGRSMEAWRAAKARAKAKHESGQYGKGTGAPGMIDLQRRLRLLLGSDNGKVTTAFAASMMGYPETWLFTAPSATP